MVSSAKILPPCLVYLQPVVICIEHYNEAEGICHAHCRLYYEFFGETYLLPPFSHTNDFLGTCVMITALLLSRFGRSVSYSTAALSRLSTIVIRMSQRVKGTACGDGARHS